MNLNEWELYYTEQLDKELINIIDKNPDEFYEKNSILRKKTQIKNAKSKVLSSLEITENPQLFEKALRTIFENMKQALPSEERKSVISDFQKTEQHLLDYFNKNDKGEESIYKMCGLSESTLRNLYKIGQYFLERSLYHDAELVFDLLKIIAPEVPEFWISLGICLIENDRFQDAEKLLENALKNFPETPDIPIHLAHICIIQGRNKEALIFLDTAENLLRKDPSAKDWADTLDYLKKRAWK